MRMLLLMSPETFEHARRVGAANVVLDELTQARQQFAPFNSAHEGYGVLKEEVDEMWDAIKANDIEAARAEAVQVAAMAISFILDLETQH